MNRTRYYDSLVAAVREGATGQLDAWTTLYRTKGGTIIVASTPRNNDDNRHHDLVAILPGLGWEGSRAVVLRPTVDPDLVDALRTALDNPEFE